jgi:hypothetical protein
MNTSKSFIAVALQIAACAGLLTKDGKASPISTGTGDDTRIGERIAKVRQILSQTANEQIAGEREVNGVKVNWTNWHNGGKGWGNGGKGWGNGGGKGWHNGWRNGSRGAWGNGGWGNGVGFRAPVGWLNIGWPNLGVLVPPGWGKYWWNH